MYKSLQAGRALAAILVVLFHIGGAIAADKYFGIKVFAIPFSFGNAGVDFFFVLSGFIILTAHRHDISRPKKLGNYLRKRFTRIYPTYWIIFLAVFFIALSSSALRNSVPHDIIVIIKSLFLIPQDGKEVGGTGAPVLIVAWSLQYEIFFYLLFAIMILNKWLSIIVAIILLFIYIKFSGNSSPYFIFEFLSKDYLLLFAMGMIVSMICKSKKVIIINTMYYVGAGTIMFMIVALDTVLQMNLFIERQAILYGLASSLIIFGLVRTEDNGFIIGGNYWFQLLGDSSYALYLIHFPLISILCKLALFANINKLGFVGALVSYLLIFFTCLICSVVFHLWIEKPLASHIRNYRFNRSSANRLV